MKRSKIFTILLFTGLILSMGVSLISATPNSEVAALNTEKIHVANNEVSNELAALQTLITYPSDGSTVSGTVVITTSASCSIYIDGVQVARRVTSYSWDTTQYSDGSHTIRAYSRRIGDETITVTVDNDGGSPPPQEGEKIAVFFWATDAYVVRSLFTGKYHDILVAEGYTTFFYFEDTTDVQASMNQVDNYEDEEDTVFIYVIGHGNNDGQHSYTAFRANGNSIVYSDEFRDWYDDLEAARKCLFVESCHSGDWADDYRASPYLAMSTSDETHVSYAGIYGGQYEGKMSHYFFVGVDNGYTGVGAWNYAAGYVSNQYPKIADYSSYVWFAD